LETHIRDKVDKLEELFDHITSCRVVDELPQKHQYQGKQFNVRVDQLQIAIGSPRLSPKMAGLLRRISL